MRAISAVFQQVPGSVDTGLSTAAVAQSRQRFGVNRLTPLPREPVWKKFLEKFDEPIIKILLGASLLKIVVDLFTIEGSTGPIAGGVALGAVVVILVAALVAKIGDWVPSILFGLAAVLVG